MKKPSEWLSDFDSHGIYEAEACEKDFRESCGPLPTDPVPVWPVHSVAATRQAIKARGVGGIVNGNSRDRVCYGYEIANALAEHYAKFSGFRRFHGRGSQFEASVRALHEAGF